MTDANRTIADYPAWLPLADAFDKAHAEAKEQVEELRDHLYVRDKHIESLQAEVANKNGEISHYLDREMELKEEVERLRDELSWARAAGQDG